jgi:hypothetical protein
VSEWVSECDKNGVKSIGNKNKFESLDQKSTPLDYFTHRNRKDLTIIGITSLHHFIGILEEFGNDAHQRKVGEYLALRHQRRRIFATPSGSQHEPPERNQAQGHIKVPHCIVGEQQQQSTVNKVTRMKCNTSYVLVVGCSSCVVVTTWERDFVVVVLQICVEARAGARRGPMRDFSIRDLQFEIDCLGSRNCSLPAA